MSLSFLRRNVLVLLLTLYGILNAILYSSLLPLWEGFDEPFHYCYVQSLSVERSLPVLGESACSQEVWRSLHLAPVSHVVKQNIPTLTTFGEYFRLDAGERRRLRSELESLDPELKRDTVGGPLNYEAQQAPLAYFLLAVPDFLWSNEPLPGRVWRLRILGAVFAATAVVFLTLRLSRKLNLPDQFRHAAVFVVLSTQMFYATTAHITNDWLAVPLAVALFLAAAVLYEAPGLGSAVVLAVTLAAGLMTKAYFLSVVPFAGGLVAWLAWKRRLRLRDAAAFCLIVTVLSGPWYWRNQVLYGSLSGSQQSASGLGVRSAFSVLWEIRWLDAIRTMARQSLWTGNNSDTAFSSTTIALMWIVLLAAVGIYVAIALRRRPPIAERLIVAGALFFIAGIAYATALLHIYTEGTSKSTGQWYTQTFYAPLLCVLFAGLARAGRKGRVLTAVIVALWAYVMVATYVAKLIPQYGGWSEPARLAALLRWYVAGHSRVAEMLAMTTLASPPLIFALTAVVSLGTLALAAVLCRRLFLAAQR